MKNLLLRLLNDTEGQDLIEYALLAALVALGAIVGMGRWPAASTPSSRPSARHWAPRPSRFRSPAQQGRLPVTRARKGFTLPRVVLAPPPTFRYFSLADMTGRLGMARN